VKRYIASVPPLILLVLASVCVCQAQQLAAHPRTFGLELTRPDSWKSESVSAVRHRLAGTFLAAWSRTTPKGPAVIYVLGRRVDNTLNVDLAAAQVTRELENAGLTVQSNLQLSLLGLPGFAVSTSGLGSGDVLNALSGGSMTGEVETHLGLIGLISKPAEGDGTNLLLFAVISPTAVSDEARLALDEVLRNARVVSTDAAASEPTSSAPPASAPGPTSEPEAEARVSAAQRATTAEPPTQASTSSQSRGLGGFYLALPSLTGWNRLTAGQIPDRLPGQFLAGFGRSTAHGPAAIYVVASRQEGQFMIRQMAESNREAFAAVGLEVDLDTELSVLGCPAFMASVWGEGGGTYLNALGESGRTGTTPTFMRLVGVVHPWEDSTAGIDLISFVAVGPLKSVDECLNGLGHTLENARFTGAYSSPQTTVSVPDQTSPVSEAQPQQGPGVGITSVFGHIYSVSDGLMRARPVRVLVAEARNGQQSWRVGADVTADTVLVLLSQDMFRAWILPAEALDELGGTAGREMLLEDGDALIPYRSNWRELVR